MLESLRVFFWYWTISRKFSVHGSNPVLFHIQRLKALKPSTTVAFTIWLPRSTYSCLRISIHLRLPVPWRLNISTLMLRWLCHSGIIPKFDAEWHVWNLMTPITWRQLWCYSVCYTPSSDFRHTQMSIERIKSSSKLWRRSVQEWPEWPKQTTTVVLQEALDFYGFSRSIYLRYPPVHQYSCSMQMYEYIDWTHLGVAYIYIDLYYIYVSVLPTHTHIYIL